MPIPVSDSLEQWFSILVLGTHHSERLVRLHYSITHLIKITSSLGVSVHSTWLMQQTKHDNSAAHSFKSIEVDRFCMGRVLHGTHIQNTKRGRQLNFAVVGLRFCRFSLDGRCKHCKRSLFLNENAVVWMGP